MRAPHPADRRLGEPQHAARGSRRGRRDRGRCRPRGGGAGSTRADRSRNTFTTSSATFLTSTSSAIGSSRGEPRRVVRAPRELDALAQRRGARRAERERRAIGVAVAREQARGRELGVEPVAIEPRRVAARRRRAAAAGRRAPASSSSPAGGEPGDGAEVGAELRDLVAPDLSIQRARDIARRARQREVGAEQRRDRSARRGAARCRAGATARAPSASCWPAAARRRTPTASARYAARASRSSSRSTLDGGRIRVMTAATHAGVPAQLGAPLGERVQLIERQLAVDRQRAEPARAALGELVGDQPDDLGCAVCDEPAEQHAATAGLERPRRRARRAPRR